MKRKIFAALCCVAAVFAACEKNDVLLQTSVSGSEQGHNYVDLGLSVKWATCNVGDTTPEGYGKCLAWGETEPKLSYYSNTYKWMYKYKDKIVKIDTVKMDTTWTWKSDTTLVKYCTLAAYGQNNFTDDKSVLDPEDDAATVLWGGKWRMPTDDEWTELREKCTWKWRTVNGIQGYMVKSKINDNSIFLPAAGFRGKDDEYGRDKDGYYWSSSLRTEKPSYAWGVHFNSDHALRGSAPRYYGRSIRAVMK